MQRQLHKLEPSERILTEYVESLREDIDTLADQMRATTDENFRQVLALRFSLKTQLVMDLQRCMQYC
jgi:hypothetical protein